MSANYSETWYCETCDTALEDRKSVIAHLQEHHGEQSDKPQATKTMVSHMDGRDWYGGSYRWSFACGAAITQNYQAQRTAGEEIL